MAKAVRTDEHIEDDTTIHRGSGNFLVDQGVEDTDEFRVKSHLCHVIASIAEAKGLTEQEVADITKSPRTDISSIVRSRHSDYSVWHLMKMLSSLGADIGIMVNTDSCNGPGIILSQTLAAPEDRSKTEMPV